MSEPIYHVYANYCGERRLMFAGYASRVARRIGMNPSQLAAWYNDTHAQALAYAEADRSDPFAYSRIMSHIANGICDDKDRGEDCRYKAERVVSANGRVHFTNMQRP